MINRIIMVAFIMLSLVACSPNLSDTYRTQSKSFQSELSKIDTANTAYSEVSSGSNWKFLKPYAEKEDWQSQNVTKSDIQAVARQIAYISKNTEYPRRGEGSVQYTSRKAFSQDFVEYKTKSELWQEVATEALSHHYCSFYTIQRISESIFSKYGTTPPDMRGINDEYSPYELGCFVGEMIINPDRDIEKTLEEIKPKVTKIFVPKKGTIYKRLGNNRICEVIYSCEDHILLSPHFSFTDTNVFVGLNNEEEVLKFNSEYEKVVVIYD